MRDLVAEQRAQVGFRTDVPVEVIKDGRERRLHQLPDGTQILTCGRCDPHEPDSGTEIAAAVTRHCLSPAKRSEEARIVGCGRKFLVKERMLTFLGLAVWGR